MPPIQTVIPTFSQIFVLMINFWILQLVNVFHNSMEIVNTCFLIIYPFFFCKLLLIPIEGHRAVVYPSGHQASSRNTPLDRSPLHHTQGHTHTSLTHSHLRAIIVSSQPNVHVLGLWDGTGGPGENPEHIEKAQSQNQPWIILESDQPILVSNNAYFWNSSLETSGSVFV